MKISLNKLLLAIVTLGVISACAPEVGSKEWCEQVKQKPKGDLSANEVKDFAQHCIFKEEK